MFHISPGMDVVLSGEQTALLFRPPGTGMGVTASGLVQVPSRPRALVSSSLKWGDEEKGKLWRSKQMRGARDWGEGGMNWWSREGF